MKTVSVVVPVYYNEDSLAELAKQLTAVESGLKERHLNMELIFVDDGSGDASLQRLLEIKHNRPETRIIKLTRNFGAVHASKTGLRHASGDCALVLAADLQDPPELITKMVDKWVAGAKFVICVREGRDDPRLSKLFSALYYALLRRLVVPEYPSGGYDLGLMDRVMLPYVVNSSKSAFTPLFAYWLGFKPQILTYRRRARVHGKSTWSIGKKIKAFLDAILGFSITPIRAMSALGLVVAVLSFSFGAIVAVNALAEGSAVPGFPTLVALITFLLGIIILLLGVIGEYLWRIFDEASKRPETVIEEIF